MSLSRGIRTSVVTALLTGAGALFAAGCGLLGTASPAAASNNQLSMFEVPALEQPNDPDQTNILQTLRYLGVDIIRVGVTWEQFAPNANSRTRPSFNAANPGSYNFGWLDTLVNNAHSHGIQVDLLVGGGAPLWATKPGAPAPNNGTGLGVVNFDHGFMPSASEYGQFVHAVAQHFRSVHFWELWDEGNWGPALTPQYFHGSRVPVSAKVYRDLVNAGYNALRGTGHGHDTVSIANLSQDGSAHVGETGTSAPLIFLRTLYCLTGSYHPLRGAAARQAGCPTSRAASKRFRGRNPGLFNTTGVGDHPYPYGAPPSRADFPNPNGAEFAEFPQLIRAMDRMVRAYGSHRRMAVYNTEYAYRTHPNDVQSFFPTPDQAAQYINQAEYISWKNPRIKTYDQYELIEAGSFPTGLFFAPQTAACPGSYPCPKPSFQSYRLPIWLPKTTGRRGHALAVWGEARAADFARNDTGHAQSVQIQFAPSGSNTYQTVKTVGITNRYGYFDVQVTFPGSGSVRLAYTYPSDSGLSDPLTTMIPNLPSDLTSQTVTSRVTNISLH